MGIHNGHRDRMRQEFLKGGLESFSDVRTLELLLFFSRPQGDVNPLAHALLAQFGSLSGVLDADPADLQRVPGVGENTVVLLKLFTALSSKYLASRAKKDVDGSSTQGLWDIFSPYFFGARNEMTFLGCFDSNLKLLGVKQISEGIPNASGINVRSLSYIALSMNATAVVLAHNHPSGVALPSREDETATELAREALDAMGVALVDHIIVADNDYVSLRESGRIRA